MIPQALLDVLATLDRPTILECGAYDGETTLEILAGLKRPPAAYYAFEADPRNVERFRAARIRGVELIEAAVGTADGESSMWLSMRGTGKGAVTGASTLREPVAQALATYPAQCPVRTVRLDTLTRERGVGTIDLLWSDVEGSERDLVAGAAETLARTRYWFTEVWDERKVPAMPYAGMWNRSELLAAMTGWAIEWEGEWDVLLRNTAL